MRRVFPAPLLSLALFALWLLLNQSLGVGHLLLAALIGWAAPLMSAPLRPDAVRMRRPVALVRLILAVARDATVSNAQVAWRIAARDPRTLHPAFLRIPLELRDANGLAALAAILTAIPGTVWSELAIDRSVMLLHVFDVEDEQEFIAHFKQRYERPLMEIFE